MNSNTSLMPNGKFACNECQAEYDKRKAAETCWTNCRVKKVIRKNAGQPAYRFPPTSAPAGWAFYHLKKKSLWKPGQEYKIFTKIRNTEHVRMLINSIHSPPERDVYLIVSYVTGVDLSRFKELGFQMRPNGTWAMTLQEKTSECLNKEGYIRKSSKVFREEISSILTYKSNLSPEALKNYDKQQTKEEDPHAGMIYNAYTDRWSWF